MGGGETGLSSKIGLMAGYIPLPKGVSQLSLPHNSVDRSNKYFICSRFVGH